MNLSLKSEELLAKLARFLWGAALFTLPVTSFRYFPGMGEGTLVRPLAFYPVALLGLVLLLQLWRGKTSVPRSGVWVPLIVFVCFLLAASSFGALLDPLPLRGQDYFGRVLRAWVTVVIGLSFFIAAVWMNRSAEDLRFTIRWLLAGFVMDVLWSGIQALAFYTPLLPKVMVTHWQLAFSMRELVRSNRVSGMAYEPAWLAGQISTIYLPWLIAALLTRIRLTRFKWVEVILSGFALLLLLATYSRGGLLTALSALALTLLFAGRAEISAAWKWFVAGFQHGRDLVLRLGIVLLLAGALAGAGLFLSQKGYMTRLFNSNAESLEEFIIENSAGARAAYNFAALGAYEESPWFGVGLGASGFYIYDHLPDWAMTTVPEIARQLSPENNLYPNPKNMYIRLLAETGLIGFFLFLAFQFSVLGDILTLLQKRSGLMRYLGIAGLFSWFAITIHNVTQDSFATPNIWLNLGVLAGMAVYALESENPQMLPVPIPALEEQGE
ncbi:MAG TPA: O-antigen ligase family protein [Anaerolineales bacterium]|nr:O-antigen ligase family protein [Anaerolineales bacterium]